MVQIERALQMNLPAHQSAFLWGPRKVGKSTYLRSAFPTASMPGSSPCSGKAALTQVAEIS